jgi:FKBP-type peptidyl-prolyl cis-trans isomerase (trigger factor)
MEDYKTEILNKICYTDLVYDRINKKLNLQLTKAEIEKMIYEIIERTDQTMFQKRGKNIYITNNYFNIRITINSNSYRIITADRMSKKITK